MATITIEVTFNDGTVSYFPAERSWRIDNSWDHLIIGGDADHDGVLRTHIPLSSVKFFRVMRTDILINQYSNAST